MPRTVLFDLGNTLAAYYDLEDFPAILERCIANAAVEVAAEGGMALGSDEVARRVARENHESPEGRVRPLEIRLAQVFGLGDDTDVLRHVCRRFMQPIFECGRLYDDTIPTLVELRARGYRIGMISNTPWGSPSWLWREELRRLAVENLLDDAVFCRDAGWRKPARQVFDFALDRLGVEPGECVFVGDDPRWDIEGPRSVGMPAILLDRHSHAARSDSAAINSLRDLPDRLR